MVFHVDEFRQSLIRSAYVRTHSFVVTIPTPPGMQNQSLTSLDGTTVNLSTLAQIFRVRADTVHLPGILFPTSDTFRYGIGPMMKMPYNVMYTDCPITFILDGKGIIWNFLYTWYNLIFNFAGNMNQNSNPNGAGGGNPNYCLTYRTDYEVDLHVEVFDPQGERVLILRMNHAWPNLMQDLPLGWERTDEIARLGCTFTFRDWEIIPEGSSVAANFDNTNVNQWVDQERPEFWIGGRPPGRFTQLLT